MPRLADRTGQFTTRSTRELEQLANVIDRAADDRPLRQAERLRSLRRFLPASWADIRVHLSHLYGDEAGEKRLERDLAALPARKAYGWWFEKKSLFGRNSEGRVM
jgi:hypothetical protein